MIPERVKVYKNDSTFVNCTCDDCAKVEYTINHNNKPLLLPSKLVEAIEMLLWYSPNNSSSAQATVNPYLLEEKYDNAIMTYFLRYSGESSRLSEKDVCFLDGKRIPAEYISPFEGKACRTCQKIIVIRYKDPTKFSCILRHMRNCIAHGRFNIIFENEIIAFDEKPNRKGIADCTAIFKLNIETLYSFCKQLIEYPDFTVSHILQYIFLDAKSYWVLPFVTEGYNYRDRSFYETLLFVRSKDHSEAYRINCSRYINSESLHSVEIIEECSPGDDDDFNEDVMYTDVYYCENEPDTAKSFGNNKYVIGKKGLDMLFEGNSMKSLIQFARPMSGEK